MDELFEYLNTRGALEEYVIDKTIISIRNKLNRIHEYQQILKAYRDTKLNITSIYD